MPAYCASCGVDTSSLALQTVCPRPTPCKGAPSAAQTLQFRIPPDACVVCWHSIAICHTAVSASATAPTAPMAQPLVPRPTLPPIIIDFWAGGDYIIVGAKATPKSYKFNCIQCGTALRYGPGLCDWCPSCKVAR